MKHARCRKYQKRGRLPRDFDKARADRLSPIIEDTRRGQAMGFREFLDWLEEPSTFGTWARRRRLILRGVPNSPVSGRKPSGKWRER